MDRVYETQISDARWMAYDLPGNVGWIAWLVCTVKLLCGGVDWFTVLALVPAILMLVGVVELISERIAKLDRRLPRLRLLRGFGALTLGGFLGAALALVGCLVGAGRGLAPWMLAGGVLCAVFAGLLYKGYRAV